MEGRAREGKSGEGKRGRGGGVEDVNLSLSSCWMVAIESPSFAFRTSPSVAWSTNSEILNF